MTTCGPDLARLICSSKVVGDGVKCAIAPIVDAVVSALLAIWSLVALAVHEMRLELRVPLLHCHPRQM